VQASAANSAEKHYNETNPGTLRSHRSLFSTTLRAEDPAADCVLEAGSIIVKPSAGTEPNVVILILGFLPLN
jgi:hypothetical protein